MRQLIVDIIVAASTKTNNGLVSLAPSVFGVGEYGVSSLPNVFPFTAKKKRGKNVKKNSK